MAEKENRKKIALVSETWLPEVNGVARTLAVVAKSLARHADVQIIRPRQAEAAAAPAEEQSTQHLTWSAPIPGYPGMRFGGFCFIQLRRLWRRQPPDDVYVATPGPLGWTALRVARELDIPAMSGFHTRFDQYSSRYGLGWLTPLIRLWLRRFHKLSGCTLVPTRTAAHFLNGMGVDNTRVWGRGVDAERFHSQWRDTALRDAWRAREHSPVLLYVGRLAAEKNPHLAISAFRGVRAECPSARLVMVGDGPLRMRLEAENAEVIFTGTLHGDELSRHYASSDIFLFTSETDTFGNVLLEAAASQLAIVSYRTAAAAEHFSHDRNACLAAAGDAGKFISHAIRLGLNRAERSRLGSHARRTAEQLPPDLMCTSFENHLHDLTRRERPSRGEPYVKSARHPSVRARRSA